jgi:hypothetical protein
MAKATLFCLLWISVCVTASYAQTLVRADSLADMGKAVACDCLGSKIALIFDLGGGNAEPGADHLQVMKANIRSSERAFVLARPPTVRMVKGHVVHLKYPARPVCLLSENIRHSIALFI